MEDFYVLDYPILIKKSKISSISYSSELQYLAIGRVEGTVEIYDVSQKYQLLSRIIVSNVDSNVDAHFMHIANSIKLIGITGNKLFEIDIEHFALKSVLYSSKLELFYSIIKCNECIIVGCGNGKLKKFDYIETLTETKIIPLSNNPILSLAHDKSTRKMLFAGSIGIVYKINLKTDNIENQCLSSPNISVMAMDILGGHLVTGDSTGTVSFWNTNSLGIIKSFKSHNAIITSIRTVQNSFVMAAGEDPTIVIFESIGANDSIDWAISKELFGQESKVCSLGVSGSDIIVGTFSGDICTYDMASHNIHGNAKHHLVMQPTETAFRYFKRTKSHILFVRSIRSLKIYEMTHNESTDDNKIRSVISICGHPMSSHISSWTVSDNMQFLAYSTCDETRILRLNPCIRNNKFTVRPTRFTNLPDSEETLTKAFGPGLVFPVCAHKLLFVTVNGVMHLVLVEAYTPCNSNKVKINIYRFVDTNKEPELVADLIPDEENQGNTICDFAVAADGQIIAFSTVDGLVFIYDMVKLTLHKKINRMNYQKLDKYVRVVSMAFNNNGKRLLVLYSNKKFIETDLSCNTVVMAWCKKFNESLPIDWLNIQTPSHMQYITNSIIAISAGRLSIMIDTSKPSPPINQPLFIDLNNKKLVAEAVIKRNKYRMSKLSNFIKKKKNILKNANNSEINNENLMKTIKKYETKIQNLHENSIVEMYVDLDESKTETKLEHCFKYAWMSSSVLSKFYLANEHTMLMISSISTKSKGELRKKKKFGQ